MADNSKLSILIATPASGSSVDTEYLSSIFRLQRDIRKLKPEIGLELVTISISNLHVARNVLVHHFLSDKEFTHLLFVDADMGFSPNLILRMIEFDRPYVGVISPKRSLSLDAVCQTARTENDVKTAVNLAQDFVCADSIIPHDHTETGLPRYLLEAGAFVRTDDVGTGILMLKRSVFESISECFPDIKLSNSGTYASFGILDAVGQYFAPFIDENGEWLSEDISFARRWRATGGEIWVCVIEPTQHVGRFVHTGAYIERMKRGLFQTQKK